MASVKRSPSMPFWHILTYDWGCSSMHVKEFDFILLLTFSMGREVWFPTATGTHFKLSIVELWVLIIPYQWLTIYRGVKQMIIGRLHREASAFTVRHYFFLPITQQSLRWYYRATLLLQHGRNRLTIDLIGNLYCFLYCFYFTMYLRLRNDAEHRAAQPPSPPPRRCC